MGCDQGDNGRFPIKITTKAVVVPDIPSPGIPGPQGVQPAEDTIQEFLNWYNEQIIKERHAALPDERRIEGLKAGRQAALADQAQLATADPEEAEWIATVYAAWLKELNES